MFWHNSASLQLQVGMPENSWFFFFPFYPNGWRIYSLQHLLLFSTPQKILHFSELIWSKSIHYSPISFFPSPPYPNSFPMQLVLSSALCMELWWMGNAEDKILAGPIRMDNNTIRHSCTISSGPDTFSGCAWESACYIWNHKARMCKAGTFVS